MQCIKFRNRYDIGIGEGRHPAKPWHCFDQNFLSFAVKFRREDAHTCCIAAGVGQRVHQPCSDHIFAPREDRNCCRRLLCSMNCGISVDQNYVYVGFDKLCHKFRNQISARSITAKINREVFALDEVKSPKFFGHRDVSRNISCSGGHDAKAIRPPRFLRQRSERPCDRRTTKSVMNSRRLIVSPVPRPDRVSPYVITFPQGSNFGPFHVASGSFATRSGLD